MNYPYDVISSSGHPCCNSHSVVDIRKPVMIRGEHYDNQYEVLCETLDEESAIFIMLAVNSHWFKEELDEVGEVK